MIGPAPIPGSLEAITAAMTGQTVSDAWNNNGFTNDEDIGFGVGNWTSDQPSISGNTGSTISDSQEPVAVDAWNDYVENNPDSVSSTTGGIVDGSVVGTLNWSIKDNGDSLEAVAPVEVPIGQAAAAISNALGVAMDWNVVSPQTASAIATALGVAGVIYDSAKGTVKAWRDAWGNILFPKAAIDAVGEALTAEGIGPSDESITTADISISPYTYPFMIVSQVAAWQKPSERPSYPTYVWTAESGVRMASFPHIWAVLASDTENVILGTSQNYNYVTGAPGPLVNIVANRSFTYDNKTVYYNYVDYRVARNSNSGPYSEDVTTSFDTGLLARVAWALVYGTYSGGGGYPEGTAPSEADTTYTPSTYPIDGSIVTNPDGTDSIDVAKVHLPEDVSTIGDDSVVTSPTDDETLDDLSNPPIPLPIPDTKPSNPDVPLVNPSVIDSTRIDELVEELANTLDPQPGQSSGIISVPPLPGITDPETGQTTFPSIIPDSGPGFIHVYNPTPSEFVAFGSWLWVTYADATIDKILNNPFDGVIGAHELYATPNRGGTDNIRSAFLVCPTTAALVPNRYSEIDCGTVIVPEFYGNYLDYSPYSQAYIYLPFIGINEVSIDDIVGHAVNIRYRVDSYSGSCIAMIFVAKDGYQNLCYQFAGSCSVEVPMAGGSQAAIKAGMMQAEAYARAQVASAALSAASQIGTGIASGNVAGIVMGALGGLGTAAAGMYGANQSVEAARVANKSSVQHSGQFGASHGAMGQKVPFIIIRNPIQVKVVNYNDDYGFPAHKRVIIGGCTGYLRVREVNVVSAHATDDEKAAIEALLKNGVYVS